MDFYEYIAVNELHERKRGNDFESMKQKIDELNSKSGPKWYLMGYTEGQVEDLAIRRDHRLVPGVVLYDPNNIAERDLDLYYYQHKFTKKMGRRNGVSD